MFDALARMATFRGRRVVIISVLLALAAPDRPAVVTSPDQPGFTALVMPTLEQA